MTFVLYLFTEWLGIFIHWLNRWSQGRTDSTFPEYMSVYKWHTVASFGTSFAAAVGLFTNSPPEFSMAMLSSAFTAGYTIDSMLNKDRDKRLDGKMKDILERRSTRDEALKEDENL